MARDLRANTQVIVTIGPFVDVTDGFTPETGITLGAADEAEAIKHGATAVTDISAATWAAVTSCRGYYSLTLTTSHTDTEGQLVIVVQDDSVCLPVRNEFQVLSEAAYDSLYGAKDDGFMDVNIKTVGRADTQETEANNLEAACAAYSATRGLSGTALPAAAAAAAGGLPVSTAGSLDLDAQRADVAAILVDTGTTLQGELDGIQADTEDIQARLPAALTAGGNMKADALAVSGDTVAADTLELFAEALDQTTGQIDAGSFAAGAIDAAAIAANAIADTKIASGAITSAKFAAGAITATVIATDAIDADALAADAIAEINATVDTALADYDGPTHTELLNLIRLALRKDAALATDLSALLTTLNADLGSGGGAYANTTDAQEAIRDKETDIETDTQDIQSKIGTPAGASVSADIAAIEAQTDDIGAAGAGLTAIPWNAAWDAEVQSEVDDALVAQKLDHLVAVADADDAVDNSIVAKLASKSATADWSGYSNQTDSLEALRDRGDAAWVTATGFSTLDAAGVRTAIGLASANLDTQLDAVPTAAENAAALLDTASAIDSYTPRQAARIALAALAGKVSGAAAGSPVFRDAADTKNRISATTDADGNRTAVTIDAT